MNRLERAYSKRLFIFSSSDLQYQEIEIDAIFPCYLGSKGLQQACNKLELKHSGGGSKKEPRKARFHWDIGFMFGKPMRFALLLQNLNL